MKFKGKELKHNLCLPAIINLLQYQARPGRNRGSTTIWTKVTKPMQVLFKFKLFNIYKIIIHPSFAAGLLGMYAQYKGTDFDQSIVYTPPALQHQQSRR